MKLIQYILLAILLTIGVIMAILATLSMFDLSIYRGDGMPPFLHVGMFITFVSGFALVLSFFDSYKRKSII